MSTFILRGVIMGSLWAASVAALGLLCYTILLIITHRSRIQQDLKVLRSQGNPEPTGPIRIVLDSISSPYWLDLYNGYLTKTDHTIPRIASVLRPVAPLLGLAGTLYGMSDALSIENPEPAEVILGFAYAIQTSLVGIFVAILAHLTQAWIWTPFWQYKRFELLSYLLKLHRAEVSKRKQKLKRQKNRMNLLHTLSERKNYVAGRKRESNSRPNSFYRSPHVAGLHVHVSDADAARLSH